MKTSIIISTQTQHLKKNFKKYCKILLPVFLISSPPIMLLNFLVEPDTISSPYISLSYIIPVLIFYSLLFYFFLCRSSINIQRLIILEDKSNCYFGLKKNTITIKYMLYGALFFILNLVIWGLFGCFFSLNALLFFFTKSVFLNSEFKMIIQIISLIGGFILSWIIYSFLALNFSKISIGKKICFFKMIKESKGAKKTLFIQNLIYFFVSILIIFPLFFSGIYFLLSTCIISYINLAPNINAATHLYLIKILGQFPEPNIKNILLGSILICLGNILSLFLYLIFNGCLAHTFLSWKKIIK